MRVNRNNTQGQLQIVVPRTNWLPRLLCHPRVPPLGFAVEAARVGNDCHTFVRVFRTASPPQTKG